MSQNPVPLATLAPPLESPAPVAGPGLPPAPARLAGGAAGLGPLPSASLRVATLPKRYLLMALVPTVLAALFTLASLFVRWPRVR